MPGTIHDTSQHANNRCDLSYEPNRVRERVCVKLNRWLWRSDLNAHVATQMLITLSFLEFIH